jgi:hypothetical protein
MPTTSIAAAAKTGASQRRDCAARQGRARRSGNQAFRDRLGQPRIERVVQRRVVALCLRDPRGQRRIAHQRFLDGGQAGLRELAIHIGIEIGVSHRQHVHCRPLI